MKTFTKDRSRKHSVHAFSLVEVALALGIAGFCLVTLIGLLPLGLNNNQFSLQQTTAASIAKAVAADLRATPDVTTANPTPVSPRYQFKLPPAGAAAAGAVQTVFAREDGSVVATANTSDARYKVCVGFIPPTGPVGAATVRLVVAWPAANSPQANTWPVRYVGEFEAAYALNSR